MLLYGTSLSDMLKLKLHFASLLCVFTALLISSNIVVNALGTDIAAESPLRHQDCKKHEQAIHEDTDLSNNSIFNLIKDPTEGESFLDYIISIFQPVSFVFVQGFKEKEKVFCNYFPLLKAVPLWIRNEQIRI